MRTKHPNWYYSWPRRQWWHLVAGLRIFLFGFMCVLKVVSIFILPLLILAGIGVGFYFISPILIAIPIGCAILLLLALGIGALYHDDNAYGDDTLRWG